MPPPPLPTRPRPPGRPPGQPAPWKMVPRPPPGAVRKEAPPISSVTDGTVGRVRPDDIIEKKRLFIAEYSKRANIGDACRAARVSRSFYGFWRDDDPLFAQALREAQDNAYDIMEREAHRRAFEGTQMPAINKDGVVMHPITGEQVFITQYSDFLADKLLRANRPDKFGTKMEVRHTEVGKASDGDIMEQLNKMGVFLANSPKPPTIEGSIAKDVELIENRTEKETVSNPYLENAPWFEEVPPEPPPRIDDRLIAKPVAPPAPPRPPPPPRVALPDYPPEGIEGIDW